MRARLVSAAPTKASIEAGRAALQPELMATVGARYSRSDDGLDAILQKVDAGDPEKSVDRIFNMIDYGHSSVGDMATVAIFIDEISIFAAYHIWSQVPTASGQESSTRYIKMDQSGLVDPAVLGIPEDRRQEYDEHTRRSFLEYEKALSDWDRLASKDPSVARIPASLREDPKKAKQVERMLRNYGFDRARVFIPLGSATNMMLVMSARGWVTLIQHLLSHYLPELNAIGEALKIELELATPRLLRHALPSAPHQNLILDEFQALVRMAGEDMDLPPAPREYGSMVAALPAPILSVRKPIDERTRGHAYSNGLAHRSNRYSPIGMALRRTTVVYGCTAMDFGCIRDCNRHRPGNKECWLVPQGFYAAEDEVPETEFDLMDSRSEAALFGGESAYAALEMLSSGDPTYPYWCHLGTQFPFEHTNQAHHFIYEAELRTGIGAHYRYAKHYRDMLGLWYATMPETKGVILEGEAEPE
jgi:thymidylate synthase ThyX